MQKTLDLLISADQLIGPVWLKHCKLAVIYFLSLLNGRGATRCQSIVSDSSFREHGFNSDGMKLADRPGLKVRITALCLVSHIGAAACRSRSLEENP